MSNSKLVNYTKPRNAAQRAAEDDGMSEPTLNIAWTTDRPTEPGQYWVSIDPGKRKTYRTSSVDAVVVDKSLFASLTDQTWIGYVDHPMFNGAKWSRRETPADPFKEVTT